MDLQQASSSISIPTLEPVQHGGAFTWDGWVRPGVEGSGGIVFTQEAGEGEEGPGSIVASLSAEGILSVRLRVPGSAPIDLSSPEAIPDGNWSFVGVTDDGAELCLWEEAKASTCIAAPPLSTSTGEFRIGASSAGGAASAAYDEIRVYPAALGKAQMERDETEPVEGPFRTSPGAEYSFDAGEGTTAEDVLGNHDGTIEGASWAPGKFGESLSFDGQGDCVRIPQGIDLQLREEFILEAWVRPEGALSQEPIISKPSRGEDAYGFGVGLSATGGAEGYVNRGSEGSEFRANSPGGSIEPDVWTHIAVVFDGGHLNLYVDGALAQSTPVGSETFQSGGSLEIGCTAAGQKHFHGRIDEVRVYNQAYDAGEILANMDAPLQTPAAPPVAAYSFDEGEGTTAEDVTGDGHTATLEGTEWVRGRYGDGLKFDGTSACATVADAADLRFGEEFTVEAWIRPEGPRSHEPALVKEGGGFPDYSLGIGSQTAEASIGNGAGGRESVSGSFLEPDAWSHLAATFDGARLHLYVDGQEVAKKAIASPDSSGPGALTIGCDRLLGTHFDGRVDELRIYGRALATGEVHADMETPIQTSKAGPVAAWSFDEGQGTTVEDVTGDGHTATIEGAEWVRGKYGDGLNFDSESDVVKVPSSPEFDLTEEFTLEAWVRPEFEGETWAPILSKKGSNASEQLWWLYMAGNKYNRPWAGVEERPGFEESVEAPAPIPSETWTQLALTWNGSLMSLYIDGGLVASAFTEPPRVGDGELEIGADTGLGDWFEGRIDEVRVYDRSLTATEVGSDLEAPLRTPKTGPVAAWSFDEGEGSTAEDLTGNGHTATIEGAEWVRGKYGGALKFDGEDDVVRIPHSPEFDLAEGFTLEAWVRPESAVNQWAPVLDKLGEGKKANEQPWWLYEANQKVNVPWAGIEPSAGRETPIEANESESLPVDAWSHLALTWDGSLMSLYIDGRLVRTTPAGPLRVTANGEVQIGADTELGDFLDGRIDEIRIYERALDPGEIDTDMEAPLQTPKAGPVASFSFDEGEGTTAEDVTGHGHTATIHGALWTIHGHDGDALEFDAAEEDYVSIPASEELDQTEEFTIEAWVRPTEPADQAGILTKERAGGGTPFSYALAQHGLRARGYVMESEPVESPEGSLPLRTWTHLALTDDGARIRLYVNGELAGNRPAVPVEGDGDIRLGGGGWGAYFTGRIDEVKIYDRALDQAEI